MKDYIEYSIANGAKLHLTRRSADRLRQFEPKDCPYKDYTLLDLVCDLMAFAWRITGAMSLTEYIRMLQKENYIHAVVYGDGIIQLIEEA